MYRLLPVSAFLIAVAYSQTTPSTGNITYRLMGSFYAHEGRLEVRYKNQWGTVCDDLFNDIAATVACRSLGYNYGGEFVGTRFGSGYSSPIWLDDVVCTGSEQSIDQCRHRGWNVNDCSHSEDASIVCRLQPDYSATTGSPSDSSRIRLSNGLSSREGRLMVYYNNTWGTVCDDGFTDASARVVCASLGFGRVGEFSSASYDSSLSSGRIWLHNVQCRGTETSIFNCSHDAWGYHDCSHYEDVYISCRQAIRLVGGVSSTEGRLEIYHNGAWGTVCSHLFDDNSATVACNSLGLGLYGQTLYSLYGPGTGPIWMDDVVCSGSETSLSNCRFSGWGYAYHCNHSSDVSIRCLNRPLNQTDVVRLAGSGRSREGRLEIYHNGVWGTVCDVNFNEASATVACNGLDFGEQSGHRIQGRVLYNHYGAGLGTIWLSDVVCTGAERSLADCPHAAWNTTSGYSRSGYYYRCSHNNDVSISCYEAVATASTTPAGQRNVRLVSGPNSREGRLEILHSGSWGTVCDDNFDDADARVACFSLGFGFVGRTLSNRYGSGTGQIWLDDLACVGYETSLEQCAHNGWGSHNCGHYEDVSISCAADNSTDNLMFRLVNGTASSGRLEVYHSGLWGTVCDDGFDDFDASVACFSLGFGRVGRTLGNYYGPGTGRIWLDDLGCQGYEMSIGECRHNGWGVHNCGHGEDVSISCSDYSSLDVRLVGSTTDMAGRLEIRSDMYGEWGTVCNDAFDDVDASVVCFSLGFGRYGSTKHKLYGIGRTSQPIWLDGVQCVGTESSLNDCRHNGWGQHDCDHSQDVSVSCLESYYTASTAENSGHVIKPAVAIVMGIIATIATLCAVIFLVCYLRSRREIALLRSTSFAVFRSNSDSEPSDGSLLLNNTDDDDVAGLITP